MAGPGTGGRRNDARRQRTTARSSCKTSSGGSAASWPSTASASRSPRARSSAFSGPTARASRTTIRMLCGILAPSGGAGTVAGFDIAHPARSRSRSHIGYMSQKFSLYEDLTVEENIDFYSGIYRIPARARSRSARNGSSRWPGSPSTATRAPACCPAGGSSGWRWAAPSSTSRRSSSSTSRPRGVDPISRRQFWDLIYELAGQGVTVFVTTHYMDEAEYCDRIGLIYRGELIAVGTPGELKTELMHEDVLEVLCERPAGRHGRDRELPASRRWRCSARAARGRRRRATPRRRSSARAAGRRASRWSASSRSCRPGRRVRLADRGPRPRRRSRTQEVKR